MPHFSDDLYLGPVVTRHGMQNGAPTVDTGVGPLGRIYVFDVVPLTKNTTGIAAAQAVAGAANLTLTAGTGVTSSVDASGTTHLVLDCARCVDIVSSNAGDTTQTATIYGTDAYGQSMSEAVDFNGVTRVLSTKAFKKVHRVAVDGAMAGNASVGTADTLGVPIRLLSKDYVMGCVYNATAVALSAITAADTTSPATTTTDDVRGVIALPSASDGTKRLVMSIAVPAIACGPNATRVGALGVDQV